MIMTNSIKKTSYFFDLLWEMTKKEIKIHYKRTVLGFAWVLLIPIIQMIFIGLIFQIFIKIPDYNLFLLVGLLAWQFFSASLSRGTMIIINERYILRKSKFPIETLPMSVIISNSINFMISIIILILALYIAKWLAVGFPDWSVYLNKSFGFTNIKFFTLAVSSLWLIFLTLGVSFLTSALCVRYRDINYIVQAGVMILFYCTPVVYSLNIIPKSLAPFFLLNPLTSIIELMHFSFLNIYNLNTGLLVSNIIISILIFTAGYLVFSKTKKSFVDFT